MTTYDQFVVNLANMLVVATTDVNFITVLPDIITDAEQRIYRELDLINTRTTATSAFTTGTRSFNLPSTNGTFVVVERINVITPSTQTNPQLGTRNPLLPVSIPFLDALWPSSAGSTVPQYFAMHSQSTVTVGPYPNDTYTVEVYGTIRPTPLSSANQTTLLSVYLPDLFFAASMVFGAAYQQNFGASADDPKMSVSWETHYMTLKQSAATEEMRKKFVSEGWSSKEPSPIATPPRT